MIPAHALKLIGLLSKCPCEICRKELRRLEKKYDVEQTCTFCNNPDSILTKEICCKGCSKLTVD